MEADFKKFEDEITVSKSDEQRRTNLREQKKNFRGYTGISKG